MAPPPQSGVSENRDMRLRALWKPDGSLADDRTLPLLAASMVCADLLQVEREVSLLEEGGIDLLHFDVMDGIFVPRLGLGPELLRAVRRITELPIDVHLMVSDAEKYIPTFADAGADIIVVHAEASVHLPRLLALIRDCGARPGVALSPATLPDVLTYILDDIDLLLLMMVNPGSYGEKILPTALRKIADVHDRLGEHSERVQLLIDGNVSLDSAPAMICSGATILVCGSSSIFDQEVSVRDGLRAFRGGLQKKLEAPANAHRNP